MFQNRTCLGVDFSGKDIKIVELRKSRDRYEVVQAARLQVGIGDSASALRQFVLETSTNPSSVVWALPTNGCSVKFAGLPWTKPAETARMARYEAETQIPLPLADLIWGYTIDKPAKGEDLSHVVIAAARRSIVEGYLSSLQGADLPAVSAMVGSLAGAHSLPKALRKIEEPILLINVGNEWTDLTVVSGGKVTSCRSIHMGVDGLASGVAADHKISYEEAWALITRHSVLGNADPSESVVRWMDGLSLEIRRTVLAGMSGAQGSPVKKAILEGEGAAVPWLGESIAGKAGILTEIGDPWAGMSLSTVTAHNKQDLPAVFSVATGLAIAGIDGQKAINLMPGDRSEEQTRKRKDISLIGTLCVTAVVLLTILLGGFANSNAKSEQLANLKIQTKQAKIDAKHLPADLSSTAATMAKIVDELQSRVDSPVDILKQMSIGLPKNCWLSEMRYESGKSVVVRGSALSNSAVADAIYLLSNTKKFQSVTLDYSNLAKNTSSPIYEFQIKCQLPPNASLAQLTKKAAKGKAATK